MSASTRRVVLTNRPRHRSRGQTSTEVILLTGLAVAILIVLGFTFRSGSTTSATAITNRIACVLNRSGCAAGTPATPSQTSAHNAYGLVAVPGGSTPPSGQTPSPPGSGPGGRTTASAPTTRVGAPGAVVPATMTPGGSPLPAATANPAPAIAGPSSAPSAALVASIAGGALDSALLGQPDVALGAMGSTGLGATATWPGSGAAGGTPARPSDPRIRAPSPAEAVVSEITRYTQQFAGNKFAEAVKIGDPKVFTAASATNVNRVVVGPEGKKLADARPGGGSKAYHNGGLWSADLVFPFVPGAEPDPRKRRKQQQTMMHEMTHHIEWINGVKGRGPTTLFGMTVRNGAPGAERNTAYQDQAVDLLRSWARYEQGVVTGTWTPEETVKNWRSFEARLKELESGSAANGHPPDADLATKTGFTATAENIRDYYLSDACNCPNLARMVRLADAQAAAEAAAAAQAAEPGSP